MKGRSLLIESRMMSLVRCVVQGKDAEKMIRQEEGEQEPHKPGAVATLGADGRWWKVGHG